MASDEGAAVERLVPGRGGRWVRDASFALSEFFELPGGSDGETDIEGLAIDDGWLWLIGSHALVRPRPKDGDGPERALRSMLNVRREPNRYLLGRVPLVERKSGLFEPVAKAKEREAAQVEIGKRSSALMSWLNRDPHIGAFLSLPAKENGFDIEGLAVQGETVWIGLRGPVLRGHAVILRFDLRERRNNLLKARKGADGRRYTKFLIDADGLGIRDLMIEDDDLLMLCGPTLTTDGAFQVLRWKGAGTTKGAMVVPKDDIQRVQVLDEAGLGGNPEVILRWDGDNVLVVHDNPDARRIGKGGLSLTADLITIPKAD